MKANINTVPRPEFAVTKILEEVANGYNHVLVDFPTHRIVSKKTPKAVKDEIDFEETDQLLPFKALKTSRGNEARLWSFVTANGEVAEVITETVPRKNDFPIYTHFMKQEDAPKFLSNMDADGNEVDIIEL